MRKPMVAGNWKMNKTAAQADQLIKEMLPELNQLKGVEKVVCPPFLSIPNLCSALKGSEVGLGAQNLHWEASGAFTGEVSASMVAEFCQYVILGHSERRSYFGDTDETINKKISAALAQKLIPIFCVGETLSEYESKQTADVVTRQVKHGLKGFDVSSAANLVIAYEPVWAIGTGRAATAEGANQVIGQYIRHAVAEALGETFAHNVRVLYGGSVTAANAAELFAAPEIDGALVGGASLKAAEFTAIVKAAAVRAAI